MKKFLCVFMMLFALFNFVQSANAEGEAKNINLIDIGKIKYNQSSGIFYTEQNISLKKGARYTLVASSRFFGDALKNDPQALSGEYVKTLSVATGEEVNIFKLDYYNVSGLYVSEYIATDDIVIVFQDFLVRGHNLSSIPRTSIILYEGTQDDFKGFRSCEYYGSHVKVGSIVNIYSDVENPIDISRIHKSIAVDDNMDGPLEEIEIELNEYENHSGVGIYSIVYSSVDYSDNVGRLTVRVHLLDVKKPVITGEDIIEWDAHSPKPTEQDILQFYTAEDSYDGDVSDTLHISASNLDEYEVGSFRTYSVTIEATDLAGNTESKVVTLSTVDKVAPILEVRDIECGLSELSVNRLEELPLEVIVKASDNSGTYTTSFLCEEYFENAGFSGKYAVKITLTDRSGNKTSKTAYITIKDDINPEFYMLSELLNTSTDNIYTLEEIKNLISSNLSGSGILYDDILVVSCDYINNENNAGEYSVKYMYTYNGEKNYAIGTINVVDEEKEFDPLYLLVLIPVAAIGVVLAKKKPRRKKS